MPRIARGKALALFPSDTGNTACIYEQNQKILRKRGKKDLHDAESQNLVAHCFNSGHHGSFRVFGLSRLLRQKRSMAPQNHGHRLAGIL